MALQHVLPTSQETAELERGHRGDISVVFSMRDRVDAIKAAG